MRRRARRAAEQSTARRSRGPLPIASGDGQQRREQTEGEYESERRSLERSGLMFDSQRAREQVAGREKTGQKPSRTLVRRRTPWGRRPAPPPTVESSAAERTLRQTIAGLRAELMGAKYYENRLQPSVSTCAAKAPAYPISLGAMISMNIFASSGP